MEILTIEKLAPYLPYNLGIMWKNIENNNAIEYMDDFGFKPSKISLTDVIELQYKPILKPLSDYININSKAMNDLNIDVQDQIELSDFANKKIGLNQVSYGLYEIMCINHIDFNRLIEKGLAISYNDIS